MYQEKEFEKDFELSKSLTGSILKLSNNIGNNTSYKIYNFEEQAVKESLVKLGWTPPGEDKQTGIESTLKERGSRYGKFEDNARITQQLIEVLLSAPNADKMHHMHKECLHMICHKMARIVCGDVLYTDNPHDIAGYATGLENYLKSLENAKGK